MSSQPLMRAAGVILTLPASAASFRTSQAQKHTPAARSRIYQHTFRSHALHAGSHPPSPVHTRTHARTATAIPLALLHSFCRNTGEPRTLPLRAPLTPPHAYFLCAQNLGILLFDSTGALAATLLLRLFVRNWRETDPERGREGAAHGRKREEHGRQVDMNTGGTHCRAMAAKRRGHEAVIRLHSQSVGAVALAKRCCHRQPKALATATAARLLRLSRPRRRLLALFLGSKRVKPV